MIPITVQPTPDRALFSAPVTYTPVRATGTPPGPTIVRGFLKRYAPPVDFSHLPRYRLTTTGGSLAVVPLYAMPYGTIADLSLTIKNATAYYEMFGEIAGWVEVGQDEDGVWAAGLVTADNPDQRLAFTEAAVVKGDIRPDSDGQLCLAGVWARVPTSAVPSKAYGLTKATLLKLLTEGEFADFPDDTPIVMSKDAEGNYHSPLAGGTEAMYWPESPWAGETSPTDERIDASEGYYTDEDRAPSDAVRVIVLDPTN